MYPIYLLLGGVCFALAAFVVVEIDLGVTSDFFMVLFIGCGFMFLFEGLADYRGARVQPSRAERDAEYLTQVRRITAPRRATSPRRQRMPE